MKQLKSRNGKGVNMVRKYRIATAASRKQRVLKNEERSWEELVRRMAKPVITGETMAEYRAMSKDRQSQVKDVGGFVGGELLGGRRNKAGIRSRSLITLDMDNGHPGILEELKKKVTFACFLYSTHKSTPEKPRLRLVIPLLRDLTPAEYGAVSRKVASRLGLDLFDLTTFEAERLMYWGSVSKDGVYVAEEIKGNLLDPDPILTEYEDWKNVLSWPGVEGELLSGKEGKGKVQDPWKKEGLIGAFCRAYSMDEIIRKYMADVYAPSAFPGRYDYIPADSAAGVVVYDGKFMYSHHATDPLCGRLLNAFDAVRLHKYGHLDRDCPQGTCTHKLPSYRAMLHFAARNDRVRHEMANRQEEEAKMDFQGSPFRHSPASGVRESWEAADSGGPAAQGWGERQGRSQGTLSYRSDGSVENCLPNYLTILRRDGALSPISYNLFRDSVDVRGTLPWKSVKPGWSDTDMANLNSYLSTRYGIYGPSKSKDALITVASEKQFHPIREYFSSLPPWDGKRRVETLLVEYLGAEDSAYTRAVTRKTLAAAVARIYRPGTKFDSVLILNGPQGIGKSTLFGKLGKEWFSDSLTLTDMRDKAAAEKLQGYFLLELGELAGMKKADIETVKSFISRTDDKYRASYGVNVESHPRQCVIVGTTNAENGFLRDVTGNRRFWPVPVTGLSRKKPWDLSEEEISQIWAEAITIYQNREPLYLEPDLLGSAALMQQSAMEADDREGIVRKYLDTLLPLDWEGMDLTARRMFLSGSTLGPARQGTVRRRTVCNMEIFAECFGREPSQIRRQDSYDITAIMSRLAGWERTGTRANTRYGRQRIYARLDKAEP